jgi:hypothetical protein
MPFPDRLVTMVLLALLTLSICALPRADAADRPGAGDEPRQRQERLRRSYTDHYPQNTLSVRGKAVTFEIFVKSAQRLPRDYMEETVRVASEVSLDHIRANFRENCDKFGKIDLFEATSAELNEPLRLIPYSYIEFGPLWGFYDPGSPYDNLDGIYFVYHQPNTTHVIVAHEVAHYWYERLCVYAGITTSSEEFAVQVEKLYAKRYD